MSSLRDNIERAVDVAMVMGIGHGQEQVTVDQYGNARERATDRILALIAEAMLSEEAVEAAGWAVHVSPHTGADSLAKAAVTKALSTAGITPVGMPSHDSFIIATDANGVTRSTTTTATGDAREGEGDER